MIDFLLEYGLFVAKLVTGSLVIILTLAAILSLVVSKTQKNRDESLEIENINDKFDDIEESLQSELLSKNEFKKWQKSKKHADTELDHKLFVLRFDGDIEASEIEGMRECITAIISVADPKFDSVLIILESGGGMVHEYGLAASQIARLKSKGIKVIVAVDRIAASGGYMMACVADKIISAPFAVVGSIGVLAQVPNFHRLLEKHDVDIEHHTSGKFKTTLTMLAKNTPEGRKKFVEELDDTHKLFKEFVAANRPSLDVEKVGTGEHWYGSEALALNLVDEISTSDDYIYSLKDTHQIFELSLVVKESFKDKISDIFHLSFEKTFRKVINLISRKPVY